MAWENFGFLTRVQTFRDIKDPQLLKAEADNIYENFIEEDAQHELGDITYQLRENIKNSIENPTVHIFDELVDIVTESLANATVTDFLRDSSYTNYVSSQFQCSNSCSTPTRANPFAALLGCIH